MSRMQRTEAGWAHWCPGCKELHEFHVNFPRANGAKWTFDGNQEKPTFSPSMHIKIGPWPWEPGDPPEMQNRIDVCHYFITDGFIRFLPDCTHALSGTDVPLPEIPAKGDAK